MSSSPPSQPSLHPVKAVREMMHVPRQWVGDGLREVVRGGAREFPPACAGIPAHLATRLDHVGPCEVPKKLPAGLENCGYSSAPNPLLSSP